MILLIVRRSMGLRLFPSKFIDLVDMLFVDVMANIGAVLDFVRRMMPLI